MRKREVIRLNIHETWALYGGETRRKICMNATGIYFAEQTTGGWYKTLKPQTSYHRIISGTVLRWKKP